MATVEWRSPANEMAVRQFDIAAGRLNLDKNVAVRLQRPDRALIVSVPVRMDDGGVRVFTAIGFSTTTCLVRFQGRVALPSGVNLGESRAAMGMLEWARSRLPWAAQRRNLRSTGLA